MVGVGEAVNVAVGMGEGVAVTRMTSVAGSATGGNVDRDAWQAAILIKTSAAVLRMNRQVHCFMR